MSEYNIKTQHDSLEKRRRALIRRWFEALEGEQELLAGRAADWEDLSAAQRDAAMLDALGEIEHDQLVAIRAALARIDAGTYGICAACAEPIDSARLTAIPEVALCISCQGTVENASAPSWTSHAR